MSSRKKIRPFLKFWMPVYVYAALIFVLSSIPQLGKLPGPQNIDKICHLVEYAIFGYLLARAFKSSDRAYFVANFRVLAIGCAILYGLTDEVHQAFVPLRQVSFLDLLFDSTGAILGQLLCFAKSKR